MLSCDPASFPQTPPVCLTQEFSYWLCWSRPSFHTCWMRRPSLQPPPPLKACMSLPFRTWCTLVLCTLLPSRLLLGRHQNSRPASRRPSDPNKPTVKPRLRQDNQSRLYKRPPPSNSRPASSSHCTFTFTALLWSPMWVFSFSSEFNHPSEVNKGYSDTVVSFRSVTSISLGTFEMHPKQVKMMNLILKVCLTQVEI